MKQETKDLIGLVIIIITFMIFLVGSLTLAIASHELWHVKQIYSVGGNYSANVTQICFLGQSSEGNTGWVTNNVRADKTDWELSANLAMIPFGIIFIICFVYFVKVYVFYLENH